MRIGDKMRQWRNGAGNAPRHYAGTRSAADRALSRTRSLTAAAIAVAMMATVAVTSLLPAYNAKADESHNDGAICTPTSISFGTDTGSGTVDSGIATYVGGDMYVGRKASSGNMNNVNGPFGSYAAEAEGLTAVNGKLLMHPLKGLWTSYYTDKDGAKNGYIKDHKGFRFGIVGFGGQYRPATGSSTLEVRGNSSDNDISWVGGAQAWGNAGWVGQTKTSEPRYTANIAGASTNVYGGSSNDILGASYGSQNTDKNKYDNRNSVYVPSDTSGTVNWNQNDDQIGSTGQTFTEFGSYIKTLSGNLSGLSKQQSSSVYVADATILSDNENQNGLVRTKFDGSYTFTINNVHEKIIKFVGNGTSSMQVFNLPANMLNESSSYTGVSFSFSNIPDTSSVVINVTGGNVDFHNGWRFWWTDMNNQTVELGGLYMDPAYAKRAQQIMWNFADASNVVIRGGQGSGTTTRSAKNSAAEKNDDVWDGSFPMKTNDDPAAGMLGSILVPNGSFESHVSTNGRVWVGGSFAMYNPDAVGNTGQDGKFYPFINYERSHSASALDMDQERHNLPWNGSYSTSCAAIAWNKVDDTAGHNALGGTSWTVYGKKDDAVNGTNALATIADGGWNDDADAEGSFQLGNLAKNGTYFLKESGTAEGYAQNTNIYQINTSDTTEAAKNIVHVFNSNGTELTGEADKLLTGGKIVNKKMGSSITWQKVDGTDNNTLLAGSTWTLSRMNGNTAEQSWNITDDQSGTEVKSVKIFDVNNNEVVSASFTNSTAQQFHAVAYDQNGTLIDNAKLTWSSADSAVAAVSENGLVTPTGNGNTTITVKSADGNVTASFTVNVSGVTVETSVSINGYTNGREISLEKGKTLKLTASVAPEGNTVEWSTSNNADNVSLSTTTGTSVTLTANKVTSSTVTITAKETRTGKYVTLRVNVTKPPATTTTVFFKMQDAFNQNNGQKLFLEWKTANGNWPSDSGDPPNRKEMTVASGCNGYVSYTINEVMPASASFRIRRDKAGWTTAQSFYRPGANSGFAFNGGDIVTLNTATEILDTAPSGCAVTSTAAYSSRRVAARRGEHRAVASVLRTQSNVVNVLENSTVSSKKDEDTKAGKFKVSDLANGTYQLKEKAAPNGYEVSDTVYTITIANGTATWSPAFGAGNTGNKIANTRKTGAVTWTKVSSDSNNAKPLPGSQWTLKQTKTFSWENGVAKYIDADATLGTVTDCVNDENNVADCSTQTGAYVDLDGDSGKFKISGLVWGEYELVESKAPDGYDLDNTPHKFRIGPLEGGNIAGNWYANTDFNTEGTSAYNEQTTFTVNGGNIKNKPGVILPGTGGAGDYWIYAAALVAALIGVVAAGMALKVRRRQ
ncbi:Cell surface protein precursor with Cna protein B-type domain and Gram-positive cocci surface proteins LPxTG motif profile [Bifidobacterium adolescentis]|uniref:Cell surface protein with Cna protein B-type domain and Gram-positive cocci surface proteins LPxTG motif profile n=2 Tax=Bifidobacterium adolescentis TaxID=1680 RepID=A0AAN4VNA0_BIFAD|nr:Cell surface protein precursor with Cna protein B-type domain and Gram-positive cocci surface proteins LPxTG motif profile [Bifidobacterium adolescentis]